MRLRKLVDIEEAMEKFIADYRIPPNVSLRHCKIGEWHILRKTGEVVISILAFVEGGMRILIGPVLLNQKLLRSSSPPASRPMEESLLMRRKHLEV